MRSIIGITMGDPAGVGPEVVLKALAADDFKDRYFPVIIGDTHIMKETISRLGIDIKLTQIDGFLEFELEKGGIGIYQVGKPVERDIDFGTAQKECGEIAYQSVAKAVELAMSNRINAIVTAPISKKAWHKAGHLYDGHTGLLAYLTGTSDYRMMFVSDIINVILSTTHLALRDVGNQLTIDHLFNTIKFGHEQIKRLNTSLPRIAVCGLNPHAGENGLFGNEETKIIEPAIFKAKKEGMRVDGPFPADTIFLRAHKGEFDLVVAQYHDQGLIPVKLLAFDTAVNITVGLPIIRTSVDHGTAFDIAGKGVADHQNMISAIDYALKSINCNF